MSPRCKKQRKCTCLFKEHKGRAFKPVGISMGELEKVVLFHDELEAIRLCDMNDLTQEEAGKKMGISRGTVQRLLSRARKKIVKAIIEGNALSFEES